MNQRVIAIAERHMSLLNEVATQNECGFGYYLDYNFRAREERTENMSKGKYKGTVTAKAMDTPMLLEKYGIIEHHVVSEIANEYNGTGGYWLTDLGNRILAGIHEADEMAAAMGCGFQPTRGELSHV